MLENVVEASHRLARKFQRSPAGHAATSKVGADPGYPPQTVAENVSVNFSSRSRRRLLHALHVNGLGF